jgi:hypothetical protein
MVAGFELVEVVIVLVGQKMADVGFAGQGLAMLGAVACPCCFGAGLQGGVEVVRWPVLTLSGGDDPGLVFVGPDRSAPSLDLDFEEDLVIDGADPLMAGLVVSEVFSGLGQKRMIQLVEGFACRGQRQLEVLAERAKG